MRHRDTNLAVLAFTILLAGCLPEDGESVDDTGEIVRSVRTLVVQESTASVTRAFPTVLEPPQITNLAFEIGGRLGEVDLQVGQRISEGDVLFTLDPASRDLEVRQAEAALGEAESALRGALDEAERQSALFARGIVSEAAQDRAKRALEQAEARADQARRRVDLVTEGRSETILTAPFDAVVDMVGVQSFDTVQPGRLAVAIYRETNLQARILVSYDVVSQLELGQQVTIQPADQRDLQIPARLTEIADRAPAVSAFPVIVQLDTVLPSLRSGMAAEALIELPLRNSEVGISVPVSALTTHLSEELAPSGREGMSRSGKVFVYRAADGTLELRDVTVSGLDETRMIVVAGLEPGERVVTAGVPFLRAGQQVKLMASEAAAP